MSQHPNDEPWWPHDIVTLSALMALCEGNPVTSGLSSQRASNVGFDVLAVDLPVIWDDTVVIVSL